MAFTTDQLREVLASKANKLAAKALDVISEGSSVQALVALLDQGAGLTHYSRDPLHPRKRYVMKHLLDAAFETRAEPKPKVEVKDTFTLTTIDMNFDRSPTADDARARVQLEMFKVLLARQAPEGSNGWRGDLLPFVLKSAFYRTATELHRDYARAVLASGRIDFAKWSARSYEWHGSAESYATFLALGGDPTWPGLLRCAITYVECADGRDSTREERVANIHAMIAAGARFTPCEAVKLRTEYSRPHHRESALLLDLVAQAEAAPAAL